MQTVSISVDETPNAWRGQWYVGEDAIGDPIVAEADGAAQIAKLSDAFAAVFEQPGQHTLGHERIHGG